MSENSASAEKEKKAPKKIRFCFEESHSLEDWVALINDEQNAPLGAYTHKLIHSNINDPNLDFDQAQKILEKAAFKNKLLRMTDNIYLNPAQTSFSSIQRAMVILGFQSLRNLAICLGIYNHILELSQNERMLSREIVLSIHSAILTALIAQRKAKILNSEPLVVAALTYSLGDILFQFFGGETAKKYNALYDSNNKVDETQEKEVVGFLIKDLTLELVKRWDLGSHALSVHQKAGADNIDYAIQLAREVSDDLRNGWTHDKPIESMKKIELYLGATPEEVKALVMVSIEKVLEKVALYGKAELLDNIPMPAEEEDISQETANEELEKVAPIASRIKATVQQLSILVSGRTLPSVNDVISVGLKGIYDGVDFDRVLFALISSDRMILNGKSILEKHKSELLQNFHFNLASPEGWLFQHILHTKRPAWVGGKGEIILKKYRNTDFNRRIGKGHFLVAPLILDDRAVGVYYADRQLTSRGMDTRSYDAFSELCTTINETIELVRRREKHR